MDRIKKISRLIKPEVSSLPSNKVSYVNSEGKPIVGVTTITARHPSYLANWANMLGARGVDSRAYLVHSGNVGTVFHKMAEVYFKGFIYDTPEEWVDHTHISTYEQIAFDCMDKVYRFMDDFPKFKVLKTEQVMVSEVHQYGGMIDIIGELNGLKVLVDLKSTNSIQHAHKIQVAGGYYNLCREHGEDVEGIFTLKCSRDKEEPYRFNQIHFPEFYLGEFLALKESYEEEQQHKEFRKLEAYKSQKKLDKKKFNL